jgi:dCMP deaminase
MTTRPSFQTIFMRMAWLMAQRSTCKRLSVGCVITTTDYRKVLASGYNGNATGLPNECDSDTPGACGCIHAEENAIIGCDVPRDTPKVVFCSHQPCLMCAKRLLNLGGVERVYFDQPYRKTEGVEVLTGAGTVVEQLRVDADCRLKGDKAVST